MKQLLKLNQPRNWQAESLHESFSSFPGQTRAKVAWEATECYRAKQSNDQYSHQLEVNENALELMKVEGETRTKVQLSLTHTFSLLPYPRFLPIAQTNVHIFASKHSGCETISYPEPSLVPRPLSTPISRFCIHGNQKRAQRTRD